MRKHPPVGGPWSLQGLLAPTDWVGGLLLWCLLLVGSTLFPQVPPRNAFVVLLPIVALTNLALGFYVSWLAVQKGRAPALWFLLTLLMGFVALPRIRRASNAKP